MEKALLGECRRMLKERSVESSSLTILDILTDGLSIVSSGQFWISVKHNFYNSEIERIAMLANMPCLLCRT